MRAITLPRGSGPSVAIALAALAALYLVVTVGFTAVTRYGRPDLALVTRPGDARALARAADKLLSSEPSKQNIDRAGDMARRAVARDAALAMPFRLLAFVADANGDNARALKLITHADALSRRDVPTQLWLLEANVARGNVSGALRHFDVALRTSMDARDTLFPILAGAITEPQIVAGLAQTLRGRPAWRPDFVAYAIDRAASLDALVALAAACRRAGSALTRVELQQLLYRLVQSKRYDLALQTRALDPQSATHGLLTDGDFSGGAELYPFGWSLTDAEGLLSQRAPADESLPSRVTYQVSGSGGGDIARQMLTLKPGRYRFAFSGASTAPSGFGSPYWTMLCADRSNSLFNIRFGGDQAVDRRQVAFTVPSLGCTTQWLILGTPSATGPDDTTGWSSRLAILPG